VGPGEWLGLGGIQQKHMDTIALKHVGEERPGPSVRKVLGIAILAAFTVLMTWRAEVLETTLERESEQPSLVDKLAPDFSASTLDGRTVSLADFHGQKKVVVAFWASWCGPCRLEMPALTKFYRSNHTSSSDFEILAVSIDEDPKAANDFATAQKLNFPVLLDPRQKMASAYDVDGIPTMFVIDKSGKITYGHVGFDMNMRFWLVRELGIQEKKPTEGAIDGGASY
jgi:peroxiredoxin